MLDRAGDYASAARILFSLIPGNSLDANIVSLRTTCREYHFSRTTAKSFSNAFSGFLN
jgi:hypothetical protein